MVASKLMVRPDRPQNSQSNPASTPSHGDKVSVGLYEPRGCRGVRIREDFIGAVIINLSWILRRISRGLLPPNPMEVTSVIGAGTPQNTHSSNVTPPPPPPPLRHGDSNKLGSKKSQTKISVNPLPPPRHGVCNLQNSGVTLTLLATPTRPNPSQATEAISNRGTITTGGGREA